MTLQRGPRHSWGRRKGPGHLERIPRQPWRALASCFFLQRRAINGAIVRKRFLRYQRANELRRARIFWSVSGSRRARVKASRTKTHRIAKPPVTNVANTTRRTLEGFDFRS